jgi:hypothetical protein
MTGNKGRNCVLFKKDLVCRSDKDFMNTIFRNSTRITLPLPGKYRGIVAHKALLHSEA